MLVNFLERMAAIQEVYQRKHKDWKITARDRTALVEFVSILIPIKNLIVLAQSKKAAMIPILILELMKLRTYTLNVDAPLEILDPIDTQAAKVAKRAGQVYPVVDHMRPDEDLTDLGRGLRRRMLEAMSTQGRFFSRYTKKGSVKRYDCLSAFDVAALFHPLLSNSKYMEVLNRMHVQCCNG